MMLYYSLCCLTFVTAFLDLSPVTILPLNATAVRVSWTSSLSFDTCFYYTSSCNASGLVVTRYKRVLPAGVGAINITLDDEFDGYEHSFTLHYDTINCDQVPTPVNQADLVFGKGSYTL